MDEPFSHVDALTAESLRAEVVDIWAPPDRNPSAIVLVRHDIKEVAWMADRIVVLAANPGRVQTIVANSLPRPRAYRTREIAELIDRLHDIITGQALPDAPPVVAAPGKATIEPIPNAMPSEVIGLLEYLDARGGRDDVFRIAADTVREIRARHLDRPSRRAPRLRRYSAPHGRPGTRRSGVPGRDTGTTEAALGARIASLQLFAEVKAMVERNDRHELERELALELIVLRMPQEDYEAIFDRLILWARFGDLLADDETSGIVSLLATDPGLRATGRE